MPIVIWLRKTISGFSTNGAWNKGKALLRFRDVEYCEVEGCRFTNSGSAGIRFDLHAQSNVIKNNLIDYIGGTGILICGYGPGELNVNKSNRILNTKLSFKKQVPAMIDHYFKVAPYSLTRNSLVEDNDIFCTMQTMFDGNAIYLSDVGFGNKVHRNYIHHLYGKGMQLGIRTDAFIKQTTISHGIQ